jgi:hypothetical protein
MATSIVPEPVGPDRIASSPITVTLRQCSICPQSITEVLAGYKPLFDVPGFPITNPDEDMIHSEWGRWIISNRVRGAPIQWLPSQMKIRTKGVHRRI